MRTMWMPQCAEDLVEAIAAGALPHESSTYEYKRDLPTPRDNKDIAIDVAAMATAGGIIFYGVEEDKKAGTFSPSPITLAGVKERISDVVTSHLREPPYFDITLLPLATRPECGYVIIDVPASPRAPHMVEVKGEYRFYGRVPGGNALLTESQVAVLYERRERAERDAMGALDEAMSLAPTPPSASRGDLHLVVHPLLPDDGIRERVLPDSDQTGLHNAVLRTGSIRFAVPAHPQFVDVVRRSGTHREKTLDGTALVNPPFTGPDGQRIEDHVSRLEVTDTGTVRYFRAAMVAPDPMNGRLVRDTAIVQITAHLIAFAGQLYADGSYHGPVDVGVAVVGLAGAASFDWRMGAFPPFGPLPSFPGVEFRARLRASSAQLLADPCGISRKLLARLLRVIRADGFRDPLAIWPG